MRQKIAGNLKNKCIPAWIAFHNFPIMQIVLNHFPGYVFACVGAKHTMRTSD